MFVSDERYDGNKQIGTLIGWFVDNRFWQVCRCIEIVNGSPIWKDVMPEQFGWRDCEGNGIWVYCTEISNVCRIGKI